MIAFFTILCVLIMGLLTFSGLMKSINETEIK